MRLTLFLLLAFVVLPAFAHDGKEVVPDAERDRAQQMRKSGPTENQGVASVDELGDVSLAGEIDNPEERKLRVREIVIEPGGVIAVHEHNGRPGMAYVLEGQMTEHRDGADGPITHGVGSVAFEQTGVVHWWENKTDARARALVVDIVPKE